jgi:hypothetical protein
MSDGLDNLFEKMAQGLPIETKEEAVVETPQTPVATTPEVKTETAEPVAQTPAEDKVASPNEYAWVDEVYQLEEKSPEKIKEAILKERSEYQEKLRLLSNAPKETFVKPEIAQFNQFVKETNVDDYSLFKRITQTDFSSIKEPSEMIKAIVTAHLLENPEDAAIEQALINKYTRQYLTETDEDSSQEEIDEAAIKRKDLAKLATTSLAKLNEVKEKLSSVQTKEIDVAALKSDEDARLAKWTPAIKDNLEKLKIVVPKVEIKDGKPIYLKDSLIDVNFEPSQKAEYEQNVLAFLKYKNVPEPNEQDLSEAHSFAYKEVVWQAIPKIVADAYAKGIAEQAKKELEESVNPSSSVKAEHKSNGGGSNDLIGDLLMKGYDV